jgi:methylglutaconyl-CoA hydratase
MGKGVARQVFFSAAFGPDFALRAGLLHEVCPGKRLGAGFRRQAEAVLKTAPVAVAAAKALCRGLCGDEAADVERSIMALQTAGRATRHRSGPGHFWDDADF